MFKRYVCVKQHDMKDCGPASISTVAKHYGSKIPIAQLRELCETTISGTNLLGMISGAKEVGFDVECVRGDNDSLDAEFKLPAIAHVLINNSIPHFVVIHKITKNQVLVADPLNGLESYSKDDFIKIWTGVLIFLTPNEDFKIYKDYKEGIRRFLPLLKEYKLVLFQIFLTSIFITAIGILGAYYFQYLIDNIIKYKLVNKLNIMSLGLIFFYIFSSLLDFARRNLLLILNKKLDETLFSSYFNHVIALPMKFFNSRRTGEITSRFTDASKVKEGISGAIITILLDSVILFISSFILYSQNLLLFKITLFLVPIYIVIILGFQKTFDNLNHKLMENNASLTSFIIESFRGIETIKSFGTQKETMSKSQTKLNKYLNSAFKYGFIDNIQTVIKTFVQLVGAVIILWFGAKSVISGDITTGQLVTFNVLLAFFLEPLQNLVNLQSSIQSSHVAAERLAEILDISPEEDFKKGFYLNSFNLDGDIKISNLNFRYGSNPLTLKNINLTIKKGEKVAFVGKSGSGKTTLLKVILKFFNFESGNISINNYSINKICASEIRKKIGYIPQNNFFFNDTIYENLCLGHKHKPNLEDVIEICKMTKIHDFIEKLPLTYNTILEEDALNLSGGQRQRLSLARALLKGVDILIMDEATSNIDPTTEKDIHWTLNNQLENMTTIMISHRLNMTKDVDTIYVMENGEIVESGNHSTLLSNKGPYYELWCSQFEDNSTKEPIYI